jgi:hypothetical protein
VKKICRSGSLVIIEDDTGNLWLTRRKKRRHDNRRKVPHTTGKPSVIYIPIKLLNPMVQSLLTQAEYDKYSKIYITYNIKFRKFTTDFRWVEIQGEKRLCGPPPCYTMGNSLRPSEIQIFNEEIERLRKLISQQNK